MCRPPRLECKNPRRNAAFYHSSGLGFSRDWTVKNAVFRLIRYVALPAIIPHGRGEGERFVYSCYGDVGHSVSQYTTKTFTSTAKVVKYGASTEIDTSVKIDGYTPVCITEVKSNHTGSCVVTQFGLRSDGTAFAGIQNNEVNNKGTWSDLKVTITVLYRKTV